MEKGTWKYGLTLISLSFGVSLLASSAAAELMIVPARTENDRVLERALPPKETGQPATERQATPRPELKPAGPSRDLRSERFGQTVSRQAKVFRVDPTPGYRNFGNWVSCQRSHRSDKCPPGSPPDAPTGSPPSNPAPNAPSAPTDFAPSGGQGT